MKRKHKDMVQPKPNEKSQSGRRLRDDEDPSLGNSTLNLRRSRPSIPQVLSHMDKKTRAKEKEADKGHIDIDEHLMSVEDVVARYNSSINQETPGKSSGLTKSQANQLLLQYGPNILTPPKKKHPFLKFLSHLFSQFNLLLILAGIMEYIILGINFEANVQNTYLGAILIIVAFINASIVFFQEAKSQSLLKSFLDLIPAKCMCLRHGTLAQEEASSLVPGDVIYVVVGDKAPADILVFSASECQVDNSSLTGEAEPQERKAHNVVSRPLEATNLIFNSTLVVSGDAYGIVIRTGDHTVLGQIARLAAGEEQIRTPLSGEIDNFVQLVVVISIFTALIFFGVAFSLNHNNVSLAINFAIGIFVAWIPEGLPATVTMLLTIAAKKMASQNVLVKDLQGVETLGAITLLATDKTGTLTRNQMTTTEIWTCDRFYEASAQENAGKSIAGPQDPGVDVILQISILCSRAKFDRTDVPINERKIIGDATEAGLIRWATGLLPDLDSLTALFPKVFELPFNSTTKWQMSIHRKPHATGLYTLYIKGAPEVIHQLCNRVLVDREGKTASLSEEHDKAYDETYKRMAGRGNRVLGFAQLLLPEAQYPNDLVFDKETTNYPVSDFVFVGLVALHDPPKHGVREAIGTCREAGIKVIMVTGDHPLTAEAIGRKINLMIGETRSMVAERKCRGIEDIGEAEFASVVVAGAQIDSLTDAEWDTIFWKDEIIFARTSPKHKLEIVRRAQSMGHIVGVTGDGVNDSPALKKADLGIAMNISGSDVSKEAASMIILDDNFASIVRGIEEGRLIFINLKKSIQYTITHSTPEVFPNLLSVIVPIPLPLSAILILVIDLGFELIAALSFAWDLPETKDVLMKIPPRRPVTLETCNLFRRRALRHTQSKYDEEANVVVLRDRTKLQKVIHTSRQPFTKGYWADHLAKTGAEVLVDAPLLSWAYLEIGSIEAIGALTAFFLVLYRRGITPYDSRQMQRGSGSPTNYWSENALSYNGISGTTQVEILAEAQSMYYWSIMTMQAFNLFACKTRFQLPFGRYMFANHATFYSIIAGAALAAFIIYTPGIEYVFKTSRALSPLYWLVPMAFGCIIMGYATLRMIVRRRVKPVKWNQRVEGLQMSPTVFGA